jgi:hypothetical protein
MGGYPTTKIDTLARRQTLVPFMVRYLTTNAKSKSYRILSPFALRYRRVNGGKILVIGQPHGWFSKYGLRYEQEKS